MGASQRSCQLFVYVGALLGPNLGVAQNPRPEKWTRVSPFLPIFYLPLWAQREVAQVPIPYTTHLLIQGPFCVEGLVKSRQPVCQNIEFPWYVELRVLYCVPGTNRRAHT